MSLSPAAKVRRSLDYPVIDADGHWLETLPIFLEFVAEVGGPAMADRFAAYRQGRAAAHVTEAERLLKRTWRHGWWAFPTNTLDRTAAMVPALLYDRLDDWGIDLALIYPTLGFALGEIQDEELRRCSVRAYNTMASELFKPFSNRIIPAAVCTLNTPDEAIEEAEFAVRSLGHKLLVSNLVIPRVIPGGAALASMPNVIAPNTYIDSPGLDSPYNYDPVWQKFVDLGVAVANHTGSQRWPDRTTPNNFVADHLGHFAQAHHKAARSLFLGGVTERFPTLNFAFLEGGVGWAANLYTDLVGHWEKRSKPALERNLKPTNLDLKKMRELMQKYAGDNPRFAGKIDDIVEHNLDLSVPNASSQEIAERFKDWDDFSHVRIDTKEDIKRLFATRFFFGCEADDPMTALAFDSRITTPLKPVLGSDISHFDVIDATEVLAEAWELVEDGLITEENFRSLTFANAVELHGGMNPDFFKGTVVEEFARQELIHSEPEMKS